MFPINTNQVWLLITTFLKYKYNLYNNLNDQPSNTCTGMAKCAANRASSQAECKSEYYIFVYFEYSAIYPDFYIFCYLLVCCHFYCC